MRHFDARHNDPGIIRCQRRRSQQADAYAKSGETSVHLHLQVHEQSRNVTGERREVNGLNAQKSFWAYLAPFTALCKLRHSCPLREDSCLPGEAKPVLPFAGAAQSLDLVTDAMVLPRSYGLEEQLARLDR